MLALANVFTVFILDDTVGKIKPEGNPLNQNLIDPLSFPDFSMPENGSPLNQYFNEPEESVGAGIMSPTLYLHSQNQLYHHNQ